MLGSSIRSCRDCILYPGVGTVVLIRPSQTFYERTMLAYSAAWFRRGARPVIADALRLPIRSACFGLVVASLGDAYNDPQFWSEVSRVLQPGGVVLFTTPSFEWAVSFRREEPGGNRDS